MTFLEFDYLSNLEEEVIYDLVLTSFEAMTMSQEDWLKQPIFAMLKLSEKEMFKARYLEQWYAVKWLIECATNEAVRQLPFEVKQYGSNGVVFENYEEAGIDKDCVIIDSISMEYNMKNVYVTKEQLANHMKELKEDELLKQDRRPTRIKLENQPFTWLSKWIDILTEMKKLCLSEENNVFIDASLLKQIITE